MQEFPTAANYSEANAMLQQTQDPTMHGFVMHDLEGDPEAVFAALTPGLAAAGFILRPNTSYRYTRHDPSEDFGLHMDRAPEPDGPVTTVVHVNYVEQGSVLGTFLVPTLARIHMPNPHKNIPSYVETLLEKGKTDPALFEPSAYTATLGPRSLGVFRAGGRFALTHLFRTAGDETRLSHVRQAIITNEQYAILLQNGFDTANAS
jgi:hypothetical protein